MILNGDYYLDYTGYRKLGMGAAGNWLSPEFFPLLPHVQQKMHRPSLASAFSCFSLPTAAGQTKGLFGHHCDSDHRGHVTVQLDIDLVLAQLTQRSLREAHFGLIDLTTSGVYRLGNVTRTD